MVPDFPRCPASLRPGRPPTSRHGWSTWCRGDAIFHRWWGTAVLQPGAKTFRKFHCSICLPHFGRTDSAHGDAFLLNHFPHITYLLLFYKKVASVSNSTYFNSASCCVTEKLSGYPDSSKQKVLQLSPTVNYYFDVLHTLPAKVRNVWIHFASRIIAFSLPCHWWESPWGCSPTQSAPVHWPVLELHRRRGCPPQAKHWTWSTDTRWRSTSQEGSSLLWHTYSWFSGGKWSGTYLLVGCLCLLMRLPLVKTLVVSILFICLEINYRKAEHPYAYIHFVKLWYMTESLKSKRSWGLTSFIQSFPSWFFAPLRSRDILCKMALSPPSHSV